MSDKFKTNLRIALPAAVLIMIYYAVTGGNISAPANLPEVSLLKVLPSIP